MAFDEMTTLSKELRQSLSEEFDILPIEVDELLDSETSTKIAFKTHDGFIIESVIMYHYHEDDDGDKKLNRITLCISSQVGCSVGCIFCVTWKLGLRRNLNVWEMVGQVLFANNFIKQKLGKKEDWTLNRVRNIVFMWMWEPLLNYDNMKWTIDVLLDQTRLWLSKRHVTISTSWIVWWIQKLIDDNIDVMLAISLHAPNQLLRQELVPIGKAFGMDKLMAVIKDYIAKTDNQIFYEYIMIDNLTDKPELAYELAELLRDQKCHVNLIPYNENPAMPQLRESSRNAIYKFKDICEEQWLTVTVRDNMWRKIKWACWQLGYEKVKNNESYLKKPTVST